MYTGMGKNTIMVLVQSSPPMDLGKRTKKSPVIFDPSDHHNDNKRRTKVNPASKGKDPKGKGPQKDPKKSKVKASQPENPQATPSGPSKAVIQSKLQAANRQENVSLIPTSGGIVVSFSAGSYELFKRIFTDAFIHAAGLTLENRYIQAQSSVNEHAAQYTSTIRVSSQDVVSLESANYTINFFHSKCKILVNGKDETRFPHDLKLVLNNISRKQEYGTYPSDECLNDAIRDILESRLHQSDESTAEPPTLPDEVTGQTTTVVDGNVSISPNVQAEQSVMPTPNQPVSQSMSSPVQPDLFQSQIPAVDHITDRLHLIALDQSSQAQSNNCKICNKPAKTKCIRCQLCKAMIHLRCEKITHKETQNKILESGNYLCKACSSGAANFANAVRPINAVTNAHSNTIAVLEGNQAAPVASLNPVASTNLSTPEGSQPIVTFPDDEEEIDNHITYQDSRACRRDPVMTASSAAASDSTSGSQQAPETGQGNSEVDDRLRLCQNMEQDLRKRERALQNKEDRLKIREQCILDKQEDLSKAHAYIVKLEGRIKDLENSLKIARMTQPQPTPTMGQSHVPCQTQPVTNSDPFEFTRNACEMLEYKMRAEMAEKMLNFATREPFRNYHPPQTPVTVIPMVFPATYPQQVYAPPRRRGSQKYAAGPTNRPNGPPVPPGVPPVIPMGPPPGPQPPLVSSPLVTSPLVSSPLVSSPLVSSPLVTSGPPLLTTSSMCTPIVPGRPLFQSVPPVPTVSHPIHTTPPVLPTQSTVPSMGPMHSVPVPITTTGPNSGATATTMMSRPPIVTATASQGTHPQPPHPSQHFLGLPGLSNHPSWPPTRSQSS